jgi:hypothetical protein
LNHLIHAASSCHDIEKITEILAARALKAGRPDYAAILWGVGMSTCAEIASKNNPYEA